MRYVYKDRMVNFWHWFDTDGDSSLSHRMTSLNHNISKWPFYNLRNIYTEYDILHQSYAVEWNERGCIRKSQKEHYVNMFFFITKCATEETLSKTMKWKTLAIFGYKRL